MTIYAIIFIYAHVLDILCWKLGVKYLLNLLKKVINVRKINVLRHQPALFILYHFTLKLEDNQRKGF